MLSLKSTECNKKKDNAKRSHSLRPLIKYHLIRPLINIIQKSTIKTNIKNNINRKNNKKPWQKVINSKIMKL